MTRYKNEEKKASVKQLQFLTFAFGIQDKI